MTDKKIFKVLVVEDDKFLRDLLASKLESEDFNVFVAVNGEDALEKIKQGSPQLVLLDLVLPGMDGFEVLKKVRADSKTKDIPIIVLSNLGQQEEVEKGMSLGANDYMVKAHHTPDEIVAKVKEILAK